MKTKTIIISMFCAAVAFVGCSKSDDQGAAGNQTLVVNLPTEISTRAVENPATAGSVTATLGNVHVFLMNGSSVKQYATFTAPEITAKQKEFTAVSDAINNVIVVANVPAGVNISALGSAAAIQNYAYTVVSQQTALASLTLMGSGAATVTTPGNKEANVALNSLVARFEIGTVVAGTGIAELNLKAVYINNYYTDNAKTAVKLHDSADAVWASTTGAWTSGNPTLTIPAYTEAKYTDAGNATVTTAGTKCYAYQVFAGSNIPHIVLLVSGKYDTGYFNPAVANSEYFVQYVTFNVLSNGATPITAVAANKIYKVGVTGGITINPEDLTDIPELGQVDLKVKVTVTPWTEENLTPSTSN